MGALCETQNLILERCLRESFRLNETLVPVLLIGGVGVGKRTVARAMAEAIGVPFVEIPLAGPSQFLWKRLFGSEADCLRSMDTQEAPGELSKLDNCLVYFSEFQSLPFELHHDFQRLVTRRRYSDSLGHEWQLPEGLIIIAGLTEGTDSTVTGTHWLCRQFDAQIKVDVPRGEEEVLTIVREMIADIQPDYNIALSKNEAARLMRAAQWNMRTLREWVRQAAMGLPSKSIDYNEIWKVVEYDVEYLLSRLEYCASCVSIDHYRDWAAQFPPELANIPVHMVRKIHDAYYMSFSQFQAGIQSLIKQSKIETKGHVVFCKWQQLGRSAPMVTNELKNRGNWKLIGELDLDRAPSTWPSLGDGTSVAFVIADDFVGSGRTLGTLFGKEIGKIQTLSKHYSEASIKILLLAAYEEPLSKISQAARSVSRRIDFHVYKLFGTKDRCFTNDSLIFTSAEERKKIMGFCREVAVKCFTAFFQKYPFGFGDLASLCVFHHTVPNDSLPILWFDENQEQWTPLFPARGLNVIKKASSSYDLLPKK